MFKLKHEILLIEKQLVYILILNMHFYIIWIVENYNPT